MTHKMIPASWLRSLSSLTLVLALGACGAESDACKQAAAKIQTCQRTMNCSVFTDATEQAECESIKQAAQTSAAATGPAVSCSGEVQTSAEALNRCTLESKYLCTQCSDATLDPSAQPPSNGAKLFSWNSCYDNNDNAATNNSYDGCLEQWGSYAASCLKLSGRAYAPGKRCKNICNTTTCPKGCFKKYGAGNSGTLLASWYQCQ